MGKHTKVVENNDRDYTIQILCVMLSSLCIVYIFIIWLIEEDIFNFENQWILTVIFAIMTVFLILVICIPRPVKFNVTKNEKNISAISFFLAIFIVSLIFITNLHNMANFSLLKNDTMLSGQKILKEQESIIINNNNSFDDLGKTEKFPLELDDGFSSIAEKNSVTTKQDLAPEIISNKIKARNKILLQNYPEERRSFFRENHSPEIKDKLHVQILGDAPVLPEFVNSGEFVAYVSKQDFSLYQDFNLKLDGSFFNCYKIYVRITSVEGKTEEMERQSQFCQNGYNPIYEKIKALNFDIENGLNPKRIKSVEYWFMKTTDYPISDISIEIVEKKSEDGAATSINSYDTDYIFQHKVWKELLFRMNIGTKDILVDGDIIAEWIDINANDDYNSRLS